MTNDEMSGVRHSSFVFRHLHLLVIDGFADFTRTQHEIIELLASRAESAIITLPLEPEPRTNGSVFQAAQDISRASSPAS